MLDGLPSEPLAEVPDTPEEEDPRLPRIRKDLIVESAGTDEHGHPIWNVLDVSRNTFFRLTFGAQQLLKYWHNHETVSSLLEEVHSKSVVDLNKQDVMEFITFLKTNNLVQSYGVEDYQMVLAQHGKTKKSIISQAIHGYLFIKIPLVHPDKFLNKTYPWVRHLASHYFLWFLLFCAVVGGYLVMRQWDEFVHSLIRFFNFEGMIYYGIALVVAKISHELGHAYATKSAGHRVSSMGMAFLVMFPVLYTDTTSVWRIQEKSKRLQIAAAGMMVELSLAVICLFIWSFLEDGPIRSAVFLLATVTWIMTLAVNLNPLMRFDGYYLLQDWLGVDNLQTKGFAHAKWYMREKLFGLGEEPPEVVTDKQHRWFVVYSYATWVYRFFLFLGIAFLVYYFFFKTLGIFLFFVEIIWFIVRPLYLELKEWWRFRKSMSLNKYSITTLALVFGVILLAVVPWHSTINIQAVYQADKYERIYTPEGGKVKTVSVALGDKVENGQALFEIENDDIQQQYKEVLLSIVEKKVAQEAQTGDEKNAETAQILYQELQSLYQKLKGIQAKLAQNKVHANFAGTIQYVQTGFQPGIWLPANHPVIQLVATGSGKVVGYVSEEDFSLLQQDSSGVFYPQSLSYQPLDVTVQEINQSNSQVLEQEALASVHGGEIAVRVQSGQRGDVLVPEEAIYEVTFSLDNAEDLQVQRNQIGVVKLQGKRRSFIGRLWRQVASVLIRESGF